MHLFVLDMLQGNFGLPLTSNPVSMKHKRYKRSTSTPSSSRSSSGSSIISQLAQTICEAKKRGRPATPYPSDDPILSSSDETEKSASCNDFPNVVQAPHISLPTQSQEICIDSTGDTTPVNGIFLPHEHYATLIETLQTQLKIYTQALTHTRRNIHALESRLESMRQNESQFESDITSLQNTLDILSNNG